MAAAPHVEKKPIGEEALTTTTLEALERDFQEVLRELEVDEGLSHFRTEYEKLHRALRKSHENEKRLIRKCQELTGEIVANAAKVQTALKLSQEDQNTILSLKKEVEKAWRMVDGSHEKEARAKDTIQQLKKEIAGLSQLVEQGAGLTAGQEQTVNDLQRVREELTRERDSLHAQATGLRRDLQSQAERIGRLEAENAALTEAGEGLKEKLAAAQRRAEAEAKQRVKGEKDNKELSLALAARQAEVKAQIAASVQAAEAMTRLEQRLKEEAARTDKALKDGDALQQRLQQNQMALEEEIAANSQLMAVNAQLKVELQMWEQDMNQQKTTEQKLLKDKDAKLKRIRQLESEKEEEVRKAEMLQTDLMASERQLDGLVRERDQLRRTVEELQRERDLLHANYLKAKGETVQQEGEVKVQERKRRTVEQELEGAREEAQTQRKQIYDLERERQKYAAQTSDTVAKYHAAVEEAQLRSLTIAALQKQVAEGEARLRQQQALYETVRTDRNAYSKALVEAQDEMGELKRKFKLLNHQIDLLKDEVSSKERALLEEQIAEKKAEKQVETLRGEIQALREQRDVQHTKVTEMEHEVRQLQSVITDCDAERAKQARKLQHVVGERDLLGTQLVRRNDELTLLYEKVRVQQAILAKGEVQYQDRLGDIRLLRLRLQELKRSLHLTHGNVAHAEDLKRQAIQLQAQLTAEKGRVRALTEELENPTNVHRWRQLEGTNPKEFELIQKLHALQKRLITKTQECVEKELALEEREKVYQELKGILARQPGPELAVQLNRQHQTLRKCSGQMKRMASELTMSTTQVDEYKYEIERLSRELADTKKKYYDQKAKAQQLLREKQLQGSTILSPPADGESYPITHPPGLPRFVGGGFSLAVS